MGGDRLGGGELAVVGLFGEARLVWPSFDVSSVGAISDKCRDERYDTWSRLSEVDREQLFLTAVL